MATNGRSSNGHRTVTLNIRRYNPDTDPAPRWEQFAVEMEPGMTVLDALHTIKAVDDGSLTFRRSCRHAICGSCAMQVNGRNVLVCETPLEGAAGTSGEITVEPLPYLPVIKDLVVDQSPFWDHYHKAMPWLVPPEAIPAKEFRVLPEQVAAAQNAETCILCGACYSSCQVAGLDAEYPGPHALLKAFLRVSDPRDAVTAERLTLLNVGVWDCTTCHSCTIRCPKDLNPAEAIPALRARLVEEGRTPRQLGTALTSIFRQGNPFEMGRGDRMAWLNNMEVKDAAEEPVEALCHTCCQAAYDPRGQQAAQALIKGLQSAGVDVGILRGDETCCGSEVRRIGEMGLFEMIAEEGSEARKSVRAGIEVTGSPHCYDVYLRHYANPGYPVQHFTQYVAGLIADGRMRLRKPLNMKVTYHDPCYLGKQNGVFEEPRAILRSIPGVDLIEMPHHRDTSLCCGGGGGRMWYEGSKPDARLAPQRIQEALETGASVIATACPFCLNMLEDAARTLRVSERVQVRDVMELVVEAI